MHGSTPILALVAPLLLAPHVVGGDDAVTPAELESLAREIEREVASIRGRDFRRRVRVQLDEPEDLIELSCERCAEAKAQCALEESCAKLLGLIPHDMDLAATEVEVSTHRARGFYDEAAGIVRVAKGTGVVEAKVTLVHGLALALDDQWYGVHEKLAARDDCSDGQLALQAVAEGSAMSVLHAWIGDKLDKRELFTRDLNEIPGLESGAVDDAPAYLCGPMFCMRFRGPAFLQRLESVVRAQGRVADFDDVDRALADPPVSTEQILHPQKYWDEEERDEPVDVGFEVALPRGWSVLKKDCLGELRLSQFATPPAARARSTGGCSMEPGRMKYTCDAAAGWGGDGYVLLERDEARVLLAVIRWDTERDAIEFLAAAERVVPHIQESNRELSMSEIEAAPRRGQSGFLAERGASRDEVVLVSWIGLDDRELADLRRDIHWRDGGPALIYRED